MKTFDIVTGLDVCVDLIVSGNVRPEFGQVEKLIADYAIEMGGSAAIFACQCAKLGMACTGVGYYARDAFGSLFARALGEAGVDTSRLRVHPEMKTGLGICLVEGDDRAILTYNGTIDALCGADFDAPLLEASRHLHIASFFLMKKLRSDYPEILSRAKRMGLTISLDTNWDPEGAWRGLDEIFPLIDVFLPNRREADALGGIEALSRVVPLLVVKNGEHGADAYVGGATHHANAYQCVGVDAIGAGDSFDGGFLSAWLRGMPVEDCLHAGCACGSLSIRAPGGTAGQGSLDEVRQLLASRGISWPA